jgi:hypothetical protein
MPNIERLDEVLIFNEKLSFLIPHEWIEAEEATDAYLYHYPETDSGWFRVSLNTVKTNTDPMKRLK